jgi:hypothetical protein
MSGSVLYLSEILPYHLPGWRQTTNAVEIGNVRPEGRAAPEFARNAEENRETAMALFAKPSDELRLVQWDRTLAICTLGGSR